MLSAVCSADRIFYKSVEQSSLILWDVENQLTLKKESDCFCVHIRVILVEFPDSFIYGELCFHVDNGSESCRDNDENKYDYSDNDNNDLHFFYLSFRYLDKKGKEFLVNFLSGTTINSFFMHLF